jgi:glutamine amidotransferase
VTAPRLALLDYGMGNLRSAEKALEHVGARVERTAAAAAIRAADGLVLPGDGAFPRAVQRVRGLELDALVEERLAAGVPLLGICVGMQLLFEGSEELGGAEGLGILPGPVAALDAPGLKVPHIGWSPVTWRRPSALAEGLPQPCPMYHVHSFAPVPAREDDVVGTAEYGTRFASVVERGRVAGVQFHPEKSGRDGLRLLRNWVERCRAAAVAEAAAA